MPRDTSACAIPVRLGEYNLSKLDFESFAVKIAEILKTSPARITRDTTASDINGWDSVRHTNVILTLEDIYGVQFADEEVVHFENVGALFDKLSELTGAQDSHS